MLSYYLLNHDETSVSMLHPALEAVVEDMDYASVAKLHPLDDFEWTCGRASLLRARIPRKSCPRLRSK